MDTDLITPCQKHHIGKEIFLDDISIRPFNLSDIDDFMVWATDEEVTRYLPWSTYTCKEDGIAFIKNVAIPHPYCKVICRKNRAIESISVTLNSGNDSCRGQLGYVLASKYWGKGIATKAIRMVVCDVIRKFPQLLRLEALVHEGNGASQRVLEKVGFIREGVLRKYMVIKGVTVDMVMFSILYADFQSLTARTRH